MAKNSYHTGSRKSRWKRWLLLYNSGLDRDLGRGQRAVPGAAAPGRDGRMMTLLPRVGKTTKMDLTPARGRKWHYRCEGRRRGDARRNGKPQEGARSFFLLQTRSPPPGPDRQRLNEAAGRAKVGFTEFQLQRHQAGLELRQESWHRRELSLFPFLR